MTVPFSPEVEAAFARLEHIQNILDIRTVIFETADATDTAPLTETLKWGQPSYQPPKRAGTPIRLGAEGDAAAIYVHCQTSLVERWRSRFPTEFTYQGNRAVLIPRGPLDKDSLSQIIADALTYHRQKAMR